jgi:hypothetical protein
MHTIWKKETEFEHFIRDTVSNMKYSSVAMYANVVLVESYFEFITRILLDQFELSEEEGAQWKQSIAIDQLASKRSKRISQDDKEIFHAVRKLRNNVAHNIRFEPDIKILQEFIKTCFGEKLESAVMQRCSSSEELEKEFCNQIVRAYAKISNEYKKQVDEKIADYLKNMPVGKRK